MTSLQANATAAVLEKDPQPDQLTERLESAFAHPERSSDFDFHAGVEEVLDDVGLSTADSGGTLTFYGSDPIVASPFRFGAMAAIGLAAKAVAVAALWQLRTGEGQDIAVDVRKAFTRFCGFFDRKWETVNGRGPVMADTTNPFHHLPLFRETRDGRHIVAINIYPKLAQRALGLLRCSPSVESVQNAILQWRAEDLENAAAEAGLPMAVVRTFEEFQKEAQYREVLTRMPLITVDKIGESEPIPFKKGGTSPSASAPWPWHTSSPEQRWAETWRCTEPTS
jgi:crotonobetainyl-CoA:carnitine CoA-transferase CaiB-like acyl-CoA transferase